MKHKKAVPKRQDWEIPVYQLKIMLVGTKPAIWRRLLVRGDATLDYLHAVFQVTMGWTNSHLHQFVINEQRYLDPKAIVEPSAGETPEFDETKTKLMDVLPTAKTWFVYEYDFGDSWEHVVMVEKRLIPDRPMRHFAECLAGKRAGPPDDCGGVYGFADFLKAIRNPRHPDHEYLLEWVGGFYDPELFDLEKINKCLRMLKRPHPTINQLAGVLTARDYRGGWVLADNAL
ncbi:MAG TPA: plasmid pRiA4b ORF-3 family protein [Clostridia bacterium]|nr:plasmid pRiA4b ORF-3 family protein [Clostridia bacterium]